MSSRRPVIGIATALENASYGIWVGGPCALLQFSYIESIQRAGAMALMLPPDPALVENPDEVLDRIDALVLAGGCDVDPARYGQQQHPETVGLVPARDDFEFALLERAIERDMPTLCVCRGMQVLNVARGGTLIQDVRLTTSSREHASDPGWKAWKRVERASLHEEPIPEHPRHPISIEAPSILRSEERRVGKECQ